MSDVHHSFSDGSFEIYLNISTHSREGERKQMWQNGEKYPPPKKTQKIKPKSPDKE